MTDTGAIATIVILGSSLAYAIIGHIRAGILTPIKIR